MVLNDVTFSSDCSLTYRTHATGDIDSAVTNEEVRACPAGTIIETTPVSSAADAERLGGVFIPFSGNIDADMAAVDDAKLQLAPAGTSSYSLDQQARAGCNDGGFSASLYYWARDPDVYVYGTVYYWQDYTCASGITSSYAYTNWNAGLWWRRAYYSVYGYYNQWSHGCTQLSTGATWDSYYASAPLGGLFYDESINQGGTYGCRFAGGTSYTGYTRL